MPDENDPIASPETAEASAASSFAPAGASSSAKATDDTTEDKSAPPVSAGAAGDSPASCVCPECKCDEYLAGWKRANADYANLKKEMETIHAAAAKDGRIELVKSLLPVWDGFLKALEHPPQTEESASMNPTEIRNWVQGIALVRQQLESVFNRIGVAVIGAVDVPFDPNVHEAMMTEKRDGVEPGRVLAVIEPGYCLGDRVLRAAKVVVAE